MLPVAVVSKFSEKLLSTAGWVAVTVFDVAVALPLLQVTISL